ncbi:hypothetical protein LOC61_00540 [Arthrobacter sp. zg-Y820]|uniref:hypothetical protein n=1 Tax=unclassified Arthrobacter TaxID=235627 RepID=UPI001E438E28|nr:MULTISPECIES: hypothetical protein [unclassified Arthrobacter]MCC9195350.1 hypothetical protein [Arthrobacter sp. zg-Y820]MDK1278209.1 hypothetical protein [Arthrobacter sp. zg.Y820]MDK1361314.1 hypothetical protein [Arthrobacter sp. zg-Y1219]
MKKEAGASGAGGIAPPELPRSTAFLCARPEWAMLEFHNNRVVISGILTENAGSDYGGTKE